MEILLQSKGNIDRGQTTAERLEVQYGFDPLAGEANVNVG
jgi:hypothetical protein